MAQACHDAVVSVNHEPATPEPTRVLIVDDQELFRRGLTMLLAAEDGIEVVGEAGDGIEGVALATSTAPDVVPGQVDTEEPSPDVFLWDRTTGAPNARSVRLACVAAGGSPCMALRSM